MKMKSFSIIFLSFFIIYGLGACKSNNSPPLTQPTEIIPPTTQPSATTSPIPPTPIPTSTNTPIPPTPTIIPPDISSEYLNGVQVEHIDTFDSPSMGKWKLGEGNIRNSALELVGKNWTPVYRNHSFLVNQGIIVDFTFTKGSLFDILFENGEWDTDPYKQIGVYFDGNQVRSNVWKGKTWLGGVIINSSLPTQPDTTYTLLLAVLPGNELLELIWDPADYSKKIIYHQKLGEDWSDLTWSFLLVADKGTVKLDNYMEIKFAGEK